MEVPEGMGATLEEYIGKKNLRIMERPVTTAIRQAAAFVFFCTQPVEMTAKANWQLMIAVDGNPWDLSYPENLPKLAEFYNLGYLGWDPQKDRLGCVYTPTVRSHRYQPALASLVPNELLSKTVMFVDAMAQPLAVVSVVCLKQPGKANRWDLRSLTMFSMDSSGAAIDRPIFVTPHADGAFLSQLSNVTILSDSSDTSGIR